MLFSKDVVVGHFVFERFRKRVEAGHFFGKEGCLFTARAKFLVPSSDWCVARTRVHESSPEASRLRKLQTESRSLYAKLQGSGL